MKRYTGTYTRPDRWSRKILLFILCSLLTVACQHEELVSDGGGDDDGRVGVLTYNIALNGETETRAIGDGQSVDELVVGVFIEDELIETHTFTDKVDGKFPVSIPLLRNKEYNLVFWAQKSGNGIYTMGDDMQITVDYSKYDGKSLQAAEAFEVFSGIQKGVTVQKAQIDGGTLSLTRPFAQVNVAADDEDIYNKVKRAELTLTGLPTGYNPLNGAVTGSMSKTFTFTDFGVEEGDKLTPSPSAGESSSYTYLATVWALPTTAADITVNLYDAAEGGSTVRDEVKFEDIELKANVRLNIIGTMIQLQTMAAWDGVTFSNPARADKVPTCTVTLDNMTRADGQVLHIETTDELAYILKNGVPTGYTHVHICNNLNMGNHDWQTLTGGAVTPQNLPAGTVVSGIADNATSVFTISNITMNGNGATGLFGDTQELTVQDIAFENIKMVNTSATGGVGLLVGTAKGNLTMQNVTVTNSSVNASAGKAGGLVGYIRRIKETTASDVRTEILQADFTGCILTETSVSGVVAGKLVGELSGYDNGEVLNFANCSATSVTGITSTDFCNDRKSCFIETSLTEDHFLGQETYCRGTVKFDGNRFIPKWDGVRKNIVPLVENKVNVIYSPYDVAYYQKGKPSSVTFKEDVDLGSHKFNPIYSIQTLDGENHTVYNLKVDMVHDGTGAAFIQTASSTTTHKNLIMRGADVKNVHNTSLYPAYGVTNDGGAGNAYGGIFMSRAHGTYIIENIHVKESKLYAACKMGGVMGSHTEGTLSMSNCSVDSCIIQNYKPNVPNYYVLGSDSQPWMTLSSYYINLLQWWYTNGEAGGLIGFLQSKDADIDNCSVTNTAINCEGVANKDVIANVYKSSNFKTTDPFNNSSRTTAQGKTTIAGRHVNQFIGDVVSYRAEGGSDYVTNITNYTVSNNTYNGTSASSTNSYSHKYATNKYCEVVGCAYYIGLDLQIKIIITIPLGHMKSYAGEIKFSSKDGTSSGSFTEAAGKGSDMAWTGGNFDLTTSSTRYPSEPSRINPEY